MPDETTPTGAERPDGGAAPSEEVTRSDENSPAAPTTVPVEPPGPVEDSVEAPAADVIPTEVAAESDVPIEAAADRPTEIIEETDGASTRSPLVPILAATTALFFIASVLFGLMAFAPRIAPIKSGPAKLAARAQEEDGIKQIARRFAENFVSLSYDSIDDDLERMTADATSNFATKLRETVDAIAPAFKKAKASSTGKALDAAILSHTDDSSIVQVLIRRTKTNVGTKKGPETGNQIVNVTLVKTSDGWKASDLSQLGADQG